MENKAGTPVKSILVLMILLVISLAGVVAIHYSTTWGPWAYSDSTEYISAARSLLAGSGLGYMAASGHFVQYTLHPPLYPLVLSVLGLLRIDLLEGARWLNILLFGLTIFLSGVFVYAIFRNAWFAIVLSLTLLTLPMFVDVSSGAMSETLLIFTSCLAIGLLTLYLGRRKTIFLAGSAIATALAILARYPGIVVAVACTLVLLVEGQTSWRLRLRNVVTFCVLSLAPLVAWLAWLFSQSRSLAVRTYLLPGNLQASIMSLRKALMETFLSWLPYKEHLPAYNYTVGRNYLLGLLIIVLILACLVILRRLFVRKVTQDQALLSIFTILFALFTIGNILLLAITFLFTAPTPDIDTRTLLPVQIGALFFGLSLLALAIHEFHLPQPVGWACGLLVLAFIYPNGQASWKLVKEFHQTGGGYTSAAWHSSQTLQAVKDLPASTPIISNAGDAILLHLDRATYDFCAPSCDSNGPLRYGDDLQDPIQKIFREQGAALVLFYPYCDARNNASYAESLAKLNTLTQGLRQADSACDGAIYFYPASGLR